MSLPLIAEIRQLSPRVIAVLGLNPGKFTLQGTNTYLVGSGSSRLLIDTGQGLAGYMENLEKAMKAHSVDSLSAVLITHGHHDHVGGIPHVLKRFGPVDVWRQTLPRRKQGAEGERFLANGHIFRVEGATVRTIYTPGHTKDHVSFLLEEENALFSGDCILGNGTTIFEDLFDYMKSLRLLLEEQPKLIYPAHGENVLDACSYIQNYISHRLQRERQILQELSQDGQSCLSALDLVDRVYTGLHANLRGAAAHNVVLHLGKLLRDRAVERHCTASDGCGSNHPAVEDVSTESAGGMMTCVWRSPPERPEVAPGSRSLL